jgi:hypothetical protein
MKSANQSCTHIVKSIHSNSSIQIKKMGRSEPNTTFATKHDKGWIRRKNKGWSQPNPQVPQLSFLPLLFETSFTIILFVHLTMFADVAPSPLVPTGT